MKLKNCILASLFVLATNASAALYTLTTGSSATASGIANSAGVGFQNSANAAFAGAGFVSFGVFSGLTDAQIAAATTPATLTSAYRQFGLGGTFTAPGLTANRSTFSRAENAPVGGTQFANQLMYVFVGNGASLAASTEFLILKTAFAFDPARDAIPTAETLTINTANTSVLIGTLVADVRTTGTDSSATPGWRTAALNAIPEPSTMLLGALGALGLLRRRR